MREGGRERENKILISASGVSKEQAAVRLVSVRWIFKSNVSSSKRREPINEKVSLYLETSPKKWHFTQFRKKYGGPERSA